jgi:hypothetical protein
MCYFITLAVPQKCAQFVSEATRRGLSVWPWTDRGLLRTLPDEYATFFITSGQCSCDLYAPQRSEQVVTRDEHLRRAYAKRGWSEAKIERAVVQSRANKKQLPQFVGYRADVVDLVIAIVASTSTAALLVHMYSGRQSDERITVGGSLETDPTGLRSATPEPDQWLWIREEKRLA